MTAGAGAALSHVLIGVGRMAFFQLIRRREFAAWPDQLPSRGTRAAISFHRRTHGCMSHKRGTPAWRGSFHRPHYLANSRLLRRWLYSSV